MGAMLKDQNPRSLTNQQRIHPKRGTTVRIDGGKEWTRPRPGDKRAEDSNDASLDNRQPKPQRRKNKNFGKYCKGQEKHYFFGKEEENLYEMSKVTSRKEQNFGDLEGYELSAYSGEGGHAFDLPHVQTELSTKDGRRKLESEGQKFPNQKLDFMRLSDFGGKFSSLGGSLYLGLVITEVAKSMRAAQEGGMPMPKGEDSSGVTLAMWKRKQREESRGTQGDLEIPEGGV
jgi:hypothetical protein